MLRPGGPRGCDLQVRFQPTAAEGANRSPKLRYEHDRQALTFHDFDRTIETQRERYPNRGNFDGRAALYSRA